MGINGVHSRAEHVRGAMPVWPEWHGVGVDISRYGVWPERHEVGVDISRYAVRPERNRGMDGRLFCMGVGFCE